MDVILTVMPTLAVSAVFCIWDAYRRHLIQRREQLHERVAYLLWVVAHHGD
jgi:hypothetical protein